MQLKILYAAGNNTNGKVQLLRFLQSIQDKHYLIKIAAYKISSPKNVSIDYTLDCMFDFFNNDTVNIDNEYFQLYYQQIKIFKPDLIISDLEFFSSYLARVLNIPIWQCSSSLINYCIDQSGIWGVRSREKQVILNNTAEIENNKNIIDCATDNYVYSHLGDLENRPTLKKQYQWVRPYHYIGENYTPCQHNVVGSIIYNNRKLFSFFKKINDAVVFTDFDTGKYKNITLKNINNNEEYICNLKNCNLYLCEGQTNLLADAYYNDKFPIIIPNFYDLECINNSLMAEKYKIGKILYREKDFETMTIRNIKHQYRNDVHYLHEKLELI